MDIKSELIHYSKLLQEKSLVIGPGGNTSCRITDNIAIKPSGLDFKDLEIADLVEVEIDSGEVIPHKYRPSSEYLMHLNIYRMRPKVQCVLHAHPPYTIGLSACDIEIKHIFPDGVVYLGAKIPMVEYCAPCTMQLAELVKENIKDYKVLVLKNHGAITVGENVKTAYLRMELLEGLAYVQWIALNAKGPQGSITTLSKEEVDKILNLESEKYRQKLME